MAIFLVLVEITEPHETKSAFMKSIGAFARCQVTQDSWLIDTSLELTTIRRELAATLSFRDRLLVFEIGREYEILAGGRAEEWLSSSKRRWRVSEGKGFFQRLFG